MKLSRRQILTYKVGHRAKRDAHVCPSYTRFVSVFPGIPISHHYPFLISLMGLPGYGGIGMQAILIRYCRSDNFRVFKISRISDFETSH